jgi:hypothetical protein
VSRRVGGCGQHRGTICRERQPARHARSSVRAPAASGSPRSGGRAPARPSTTSRAPATRPPRSKLQSGGDGAPCSPTFSSQLMVGRAVATRSHSPASWLPRRRRSRSRTSADRSTAEGPRRDSQLRWRSQSACSSVSASWQGLTHSSWFEAHGRSDVADRRVAEPAAGWPVVPPGVSRYLLGRATCPLLVLPARATIGRPKRPPLSATAPSDIRGSVADRAA